MRGSKITDTQRNVLSRAVLGGGVASLTNRDVLAGKCLARKGLGEFRELGFESPYPAKFTLGPEGWKLVGVAGEALTGEAPWKEPQK